MSQQGPWGPRGPTGPTGMTGRRGLQGFPYGPQGANFFSPEGRFTAYSNSSTNPIVPTTSTYGTTYLVSNGVVGPTGLASGISGYSMNVTLPASMSSNDVGAYWIFNANNGYPLQLNLSNGTAVYYGVTGTYVCTSSSIALAYSGTGTSYIAL